jgi:rod shape-determining protein MreC
MQELREKRIYFGLLALLVLIFLNLPFQASRRARGFLRDAFYPFERTLVAGGRRSRMLFDALGHKARLAAENERLVHELAEREFRILELQQIRRENESLRQQLGFAILSPRTLLLAEVTARGELGGWWQTIRINKGHRDGVLPDMAVITSEGLIGRTLDVTSRSSEVLLIMDPNSKLSAKIDRNRVFGVMHGAGVRASGKAGVELLASARPAEIRYLPTNHEILAGDQVVTSGLGHVFPEGLPVGQVVSVRMHASGLYQVAEVRPFADLRSLQHVFVVLD